MAIFKTKTGEFEEKVFNAKIGLVADELEYVLEVIRNDNVTNKTELLAALEKRRAADDSVVSSKMTPQERTKLIGGIIEAVNQLK